MPHTHHQVLVEEMGCGGGGEGHGGAVAMVKGGGETACLVGV